MFQAGRVVGAERGVRVSVDEVGGVESFAVDDQLQYVGSAVVAGCVEVVPLPADPVQVDVGADQPFLGWDGWDHPVAVRSGDAGAAVEDQPVGIAAVVGDDGVPDRDVVRDVGEGDQGRGGQHVDASFPGDEPGQVAGGGSVARPDRDVQVL